MTTEFEQKKQRHASGESSKSAESVGSYIPTPPDGGYGWVIVLASFINHILVDGISFTFGVFYMEFLRYFKESKGKTALVGSLLVGTYLMTGPIASALTNRFGCRIVCIVGAFIASGSFFLSTFSNSINVLMLTYGVMAGFGFGLVYLPSVISVSYYFEKKRALATGIAVCGAGVGGFMFAPIGRILLQKFDWKNAMMIVSAVVLNSVICGALLRPLEAKNKTNKPREKNVIDRLVEKARNKLGIRRSESICEANHPDSVAEKVHQMKLNREKLIREEDGESEYGSTPGVHITSRSGSVGNRPRVGSIKIANGEVNVPDILVEGEVHDGPHEDTQMLSPTSPTDRKPIYINPNKHSNPLMAAILKRKLNEMEGVTNSQKQSTEENASISNCNEVGKGDNSKPFRALESAPNLAHNKVTIHENLINGQGKYHSDIWHIKKRNVKQRRNPSIPKEDYSRPMYRKDIFYSGSVRHIPEFQSNPDVTSYVQSMTAIPDDTPPEDESKFWKVCCLPKVSKDVLKTMMDVSLLKDPIFTIAALANAFGMLGVYVPFVFIAERAIGLGIDEAKAAFLLSVIGITNTIGRILAGFLADFKWVNSLLLHNIAVIIAGVCCIFNMFCTTYPLMCAFAAVFGLCFATWISLTSIILCDLLGMEKLTNAFGLLTMVRGICSVAGPPLAGAVYDATKNFDAAFHVGGVILIITGLLFLLLHLPCIQRRKYKKDTPQIVVVETEEDLLNASSNA